MMQRILFLVLFSVSLSAVVAAQEIGKEKFVTISDRQLPIAYEVDVLVVGGSTGDVAAAIEAAKAGAKTMLITDRPYLGDDMTATLQLWLEPDAELDDPLAAAIYNDPDRGKPTSPVNVVLGAQKKIPFTYNVAEPIAAAHPDTASKNRLYDGKATNPTNESIQIDGDATITVDLQKSQPVGVVSLFGFYRKDEFVIGSAAVSASDDAKTWKEIGNAPLAPESEGVTTRDAALEFRLVLDQPLTTRYLKLNVKKAETASRVLLGEIVVLSDKDLIPKPLVTTWQPKEGEKYTHPAPRPMHVKMVLDKALEEAGVKFLYSTYFQGTLFSKTENDARGAVINNRAGKQAILAKKIIGLFNAKGGPISPVTSGTAEFVVIGGAPKEIDAEQYPLLKNASYEIMGEPFYGAFAHSAFYGRGMPSPIRARSGTFPIIRYTFPLEGDTAAKCFAGDLKAIGELEKQIRLATYDPNQQFTTDKISFRAKGVKYLNTPQIIAVGRKFGTATAKEAAKIGKINPADLGVLYNPLYGGQKPETVPGDVKESLSNVKVVKEPLGYVKQGEQKIPVVGEYDVIVVGGGTTGAPAGIAAARQGAKTLVLEYLHDLGGMGTAGAISIYYWGNRVGFTKEVEDGKASWIIEHRNHWWRSKLAEAGADVWYGVLGTGAIVESGGSTPRVKGVVIATPQGPKAVLTKNVIDATGNGDLAIAAGAETIFVDNAEIAAQGHGLPPRHLGMSYTNTDYMYVEETDMEDLTHVFVYGKEKFPWSFDMGKIIDSRERRIVVGDFTFTALDQVNKRTYPDTICRTRSNFDSHGYTTDPFFEIVHLHHDGHFCDIPLRSCLPLGLDGIFVGGLATSCHRDAIPIIRMQPDLQNQGYALGCLAAKAAKDNVPLRQLDIKPVQQHLVDIGNLPESVLTDIDNYGETIKDLPDAIKTVTDDFKGTTLLLWYPDESLPLLKEAYSKAKETDHKIAYAKLLAALGDSTGADALLDAVKEFDEWDKGWNFRGMGQFGWASSPLDRYIMMLGRTKDKRGAAVIAEKMLLLKAEDDFSHHRACALALEWIGDKSAAPALAAMLKKPDVAGYVHLDWETARKWDQADPKGGTAEKSRRDSLIEIGYARALYKLGDHEGIGKKILEDYVKDLRGYFSRHASEVLKQK
ncbi:MAG: FAD-dependent oxidoreductase [Planctomycetaceae bacterium]|nr:FAD-dependent oxidoreductase [Planctomycetaceae bacterium]